MTLAQRWRTRGLTVLTYVIVIIYLFPALWMVLTGFKTESQAYSSIPTLLFQPTLSQFKLALGSGFGGYLTHSVMASFISTGIALLLGIPAAYAMVFHMPYKPSRNMLFFVLSTRFMPFAAIIVPLYILYTHFHLLDTITGLVLVYTSMNLPLIIWMGRSYFLDIPEGIIEASRIDGCSPWQSLLKVALPLSSSGLTASALLAIIFAWNDFFFAVNFTFTNVPTLPIMVSSFMTSESLFIAKLSALGTLVTIVPVALGLYAQRHLVRGLTAGAVK